MASMKCPEFLVENDALLIVEDDEAAGDESCQRSLAGKLWTENPFNTRAFKQTMVEAWRLKKPVDVQELGKNLFLFIFSNKRDLENVLSSGPWNFDRHVLVLKRSTGNEQPSEMALDSTSLWARVYDLPLRLRTESMATRLGNMMGVFEEADNRDCNRLGKFLRVKVSIDLKKPVKRGTVIRFQGKDLKVFFRYERLPTFCFICGKLGHQMKDCDDDENSGDGAFDEREEKELPFGPWLRASPPPKQNFESRKESLPGSCSKNLFASSSSSKVGVSGKSNEESDVGPTPKACEIAEPTLAQLLGRGKVAASELEEVAESLGFIDLTPINGAEKKKEGLVPECTSKAPTAKPKSKQRSWVRQKGRTVKKVKGIEIKESALGKRQLFEVHPPDGLMDNDREGSQKKQVTRMDVDVSQNEPEGVLESQHLLSQ